MSQFDKPHPKGDRAAPQSPRLQHLAAELELEREKAKLAFVSERILIVQRGVLEYAQIAIRTVILANGATATAILAYLGDSADRLPVGGVRSLGLAVVLAALGVAAGFLATIFAYLSQWQIARREAVTMQLEPAGSRWERTVGVICLFIGLLAFLGAIVAAVVAYSRLY